MTLPFALRYRVPGRRVLAGSKPLAGIQTGLDRGEIELHGNLVAHEHAVRRNEAYRTTTLQFSACAWTTM